MESIRIAKKDVYSIEVNDKGETIEFDLLDVSLPLKFDKAFAEVNRIHNDLKAQLVIISRKEDSKQEDRIMTVNEEATIKAWDAAFKEMRIAMDGFLGEGACQKIFGSRNYIEMYEDLYEALAPHFDKMKLSTDGIMERIKSKYGKADDGVLR